MKNELPTIAKNTIKTITVRDDNLGDSSAIFSSLTQFSSLITTIVKFTTLTLNNVRYHKDG